MELGLLGSSPLFSKSSRTSGSFWAWKLMGLVCSGQAGDKKSCRHSKAIREPGIKPRYLPTQNNVLVLQLLFYVITFALVSCAADSFSPWERSYARDYLCMSAMRSQGKAKGFTSWLDPPTPLVAYMIYGPRLTLPCCQLYHAPAVSWYAVTKLSSEAIITFYYAPHTLWPLINHAPMRVI